MLGLVAVLGGCGEPEVGGSGQLEGEHLTLAGTPYQMGWWHGHLLKDRIRGLHEAWQREAFALDGALTSPATQERRRAALALVDPVLAKHLPEAIRQEFQGLSDACGLPVRTLLLTEMITDILRFTEKAPRLIGGVAFMAGSEVSCGIDSGGPWHKLLLDQWIWVTRAAPDGRSRTVLTWPGGLGGVLAARADGLVVSTVEFPLENSREGMAGVPFRLSVRLALERATDPASLLAGLAHTTGHEVVVADLRSSKAWQQVLARVSDEAIALPAAAPPPRNDVAVLPFVAGLEQGVVVVRWGGAGKTAGRLRVP